MRARRSYIAMIAAVMMFGATAPLQAQEQPPTCFGQEATIVGTEGDDTLIGTEGHDTIVGLGGNDIIEGGGGIADRICGGAGDDELSDPDGTFIAGDDGNDTITAGSSEPGDFTDFQIVAGPGNDAITSTTETDATDISAGPGNDTIDAQGSGDTLTFASSDRGVRVDLTQGSATGDGSDTVSGIESVVGSRFADTLIGTDAKDSLWGKGGNDRLVGKGGPDDFMIGEANDRVDGGAGSDWLHFVGYLAQLHGTANLTTGRATIQDDVTTFTSIENADGGARLIGNAMANHLYSGPGKDFIDGKRGDDVIKPGGSDDRVWAGEGNDVVDGCAGGNDRINLGPGNDVMHPAGEAACGQAPGADLIDGGAGRDLVTYASISDWAVENTYVDADLERGACVNCDPGEKRAQFTSIEALRGSDGNDFLRGDERANSLFGGAGDDLLDGRGGRDELDGGDGVDDCRNGETLVSCE